MRQSELISVLKISLYHTTQAERLSRVLQKAATRDGMHGTASWHETAAREAAKAAQLIENTIAKVTKEI